MFDFIVYFWYVYLKPFLTFMLGVVFAGLSIIIMYAEIANFFDAQDNIIYNIVTAPQFSLDSSYFLAHVSPILLTSPAGLPYPLGLPSRSH